MIPCPIPSPHMVAKYSTIDIYHNVIGMYRYNRNALIIIGFSWLLSSDRIKFANYFKIKYGHLVATIRSW